MKNKSNKQIKRKAQLDKRISHEMRKTSKIKKAMDFMGRMIWLFAKRAFIGYALFLLPALFYLRHVFGDQATLGYASEVAFYNGIYTALLWPIFGRGLIDTYKLIKMIYNKAKH